MNKKGFTLVELLAVIVILVLIVSISIAFYNNYKKSSTNMLTKAEIAMLMDAGANYYKEYGKDKNYIYYEDTKGNTVSCVRIQSLIDSGYYKTNVKFLKEGLSYNKTVVKITENYQGVINYDLVEDYTKDISVCTDFDYASNISKQSVSASNNKNVEVTINGDIDRDINYENGYDLTLNIDADVYKEELIHNQIYVLIVLDTSSSMRKGKYRNAVDASINLSKSLINNSKIGDGTYVGLINFSTNANIKREFEHKILEKKDFSSPDGATAIGDALNKSYNYIINKKISNDAYTFVVFLTDGEADDCIDFKREKSNSNGLSVSLNIPKYTCAEQAKKITDNKNTKLIFIGYEISRDFYKKLSSIDSTGKLCNNSDYTDTNGKKHCYFNSNSKGVNNLFDKLATGIINSYMTLSGGEIHFKFNDVIKTANGSLNDVIKFKSDFNNDIQKKYKIFIDEQKLKAKYGCDLSSCGSIPLFDESNSYVKLIGTDNEDKGRIKLTSPMISIKKNEVVYVN